MSQSKRKMKTTPRASGDTLPENFVLIVGSNRGLEGFSSSDDCEDLMREFFKELEFEYLTPFVCASAQAPAPAPSGGGRTKSRSQPVDVYGQPYVLKPEFLDVAVLACAGDFKNVMSQALTDHVQKGTPICDFKKYFRQLSGLPIHEKRCAIRDAHKVLVEAGHRFGTYVEVRLQGPAEARWSETAADDMGVWLASTDDDEELG